MGGTMKLSDEERDYIGEGFDKWIEKNINDLLNHASDYHTFIRELHNIIDLLNSFINVDVLTAYWRDKIVKLNNVLLLCKDRIKVIDPESNENAILLTKSLTTALYVDAEKLNKVSPMHVYVESILPMEMIYKGDMEKQIIHDLVEIADSYPISGEGLDDYDDDYECPEIDMWCLLIGDFNRMRRMMFSQEWYSYTNVMFPRISIALNHIELWKLHDYDYFLLNLRVIDSLYDNKEKSVLERYRRQADLLSAFISKKVDENSADNREIINKAQCLYNLLQFLIEDTTLEQYRYQIELKLEERNLILSNLSHSIKNILKSVIDPLENLKAELPENAFIFNTAIRGANVIREMVNAINSSLTTTLVDLRWDISHPDREGISLQDMIRDSLFYSVSNMFDFRYFPVFAENYFPMSLSKDEYNKISDNWREVSAAHEIDKLKAYLQNYMFCLELNLDESAEYKVGNDKSSAIKLMILFQEIIFNAVKYASFVSKEQRSIRVSLTEHDTKLRFTVENTWKPEVKAKTTGVGKLVIENFARVLNTEPVIETTETTYTITMEFNNFWRNNAEDTLH